MEIFPVMILLFVVQHAYVQRIDSSPFPADSHYSMNINMPDVRPTEVS